MPRKLKTYQTSQGFFDLAVATPSMKAALEAWGANSNLFHQGFANEAEDPKVIAATMERPGVVLKRPVGTNEPYRENAHLPTNLPASAPRPKRKEPPKTAKKHPSSKADDKRAREAALRYEREKRVRERVRRREEAALAKQLEQRRHAVEKAEAALTAAKSNHDARIAEIEDARAALDKSAAEETERWDRLRERLSAALRKARE